MRRSRGFTLIELAVVLLIIGIGAAAVTLRVQGRVGQAALADAVGAIQRYDGATRAAARRQGKAFVLSVDLDAGTLGRSEVGSSAATPTLALPRGVRVTRVLTADTSVDYGTAAVRISSRGLSCSYAVQLEADGRRRWLLAPGLTGVMMELDDETQVRDILLANAANDASGSRPDAG